MGCSWRLRQRRPDIGRGRLGTELQLIMNGDWGLPPPWGHSGLEVLTTIRLCEEPMLQNYVLLREFLPRDQEVFCSLQEDQDVGQFVDWLPRTRYQAEVAFWDALEQQVMPIRSRFFYAVEVDSIVAGSVGFTLLSGGSADCGWFLRKNFWGKGIGTKAVALLVEDAFVKGISKLRASARSQNIGSIRVAEKCGFQRLGEKNGRVFFEVIDNRKICPAVS